MGFTIATFNLFTSFGKTAWFPKFLFVAFSGFYCNGKGRFRIALFLSQQIFQLLIFSQHLDYLFNLLRPVFFDNQSHISISDNYDIF